MHHPQGATWEAHATTEGQFSSNLEPGTEYRVHAPSWQPQQLPDSGSLAVGEVLQNGSRMEYTHSVHTGYIQYGCSAAGRWTEVDDGVALVRNTEVTTERPKNLQHTNRPLIEKTSTLRCFEPGTFIQHSCRCRSFSLIQVRAARERVPMRP